MDGAFFPEARDNVYGVLTTLSIMAVVFTIGMDREMRVKLMGFLRKKLSKEG